MNRMGRGDGSTGTSARPLLVRTGDAELSLSAGPAYLVGRDPQADIVIADGRVSWQHAVLRVEDGHWVLADNGSTNGSYVAGRRADRIEFDGEGQVRLGDPADGPLLSCLVTQMLRIGRSLDNDMVIPHLSVSSHHAELRTVPGAGHSVMGDNPAGFLAAVEPFLRSLAPA